MILKVIGVIGIVLVLYFAFAIGLFFYKEKHLPTQPTIDQSDKTFGSGPTLRYIAAGDSTGVGIGASSAEKTYPYQIAQSLAKNHTVLYKNISVSGFKTRDVIKDQLQQIIAYKPDIITISMGGNDATHLVSEKALLANYKTIITTLEAQTSAKIYITDIPHFWGVTLLPQFYVLLLEARSSYLNPKILSLETARTKIVNVHDFGWENYPDLSKTYSIDGFHPNDLGYQNWTAAFLDKIDNN